MRRCSRRGIRVPTTYMRVTTITGTHFLEHLST
jgi:hypothetical protein